MKEATICGCKYCNEDYDFKTFGLFRCIQRGHLRYKYDVYLYKNYLRIGDDSNKIIEFNYCPMCGRKLE